MSFQLVQKSVTLNDLERGNGRYIALFHFCYNHLSHAGVDAALLACTARRDVCYVTCDVQL